MGSVLKSFFSVTLKNQLCNIFIKCKMEGDMQATFDNCNNFNIKLQDTLKGLISANGERKDEIDSLRNDHEELKKNFESFQTSAERENDLRKNEIKSLEEKTMKENQARITDIAKLDGKLETENNARKSDISSLD